MRSLILACLAASLVLCCVPCAAQAQGNPFLGSGDNEGVREQAAPAEQPGAEQPGAEQSGAEQSGAEQPEADQAVRESVSPEDRAPSLVARAKAWLVAVQRDLNRDLSSAIRAFKEQGGGAFQVLVLLVVSFVYGLLHALGPGHGKSVASAYFVSRGGTLRQALCMGLATGLVHALSAVVVVLGVYWLLHGALSANFERASARISQVGFACVALLGLVLTVGSLRRIFAGEQEPQEKGPGRHYLAVSLASGLIPCPGAALILFFALSLDAPFLGLACVAAMSLGMGLTIASAAMVTVCCRGAALRVSSSRQRLWRGLSHALSLSGSLLVLLLGLLLFLSSLEL